MFYAAMCELKYPVAISSFISAYTYSAIYSNIHIVSLCVSAARLTHTLFSPLPHTHNLLLCAYMCIYVSAFQIYRPPTVYPYICISPFATLMLSIYTYEMRLTVMNPWVIIKLLIFRYVKILYGFRMFFRSDECRARCGAVRLRSSAAGIFGAEAASRRVHPLDTAYT